AARAAGRLRVPAEVIDPLGADGKIGIIDGAGVRGHRLRVFTRGLQARRNERRTRDGDDQSWFEASQRSSGQGISLRHCPADHWRSQSRIAGAVTVPWKT